MPNTTVSNLSQGVQRTVTRNVVNFKVGDYVGSRLRTEHIRGIVTGVQGMDYLTIRTHTGAVLTEVTLDADYFYIIKGVDENDNEHFHRHINHQELTR